MTDSTVAATSPAATPRVAGGKRSRKPPFPNSVLDRAALVAALDRAGLAVKATHLDAFYQALHRQHYPDDLATFVANYYRFEERKGSDEQEPFRKPLKNAVTTRKNVNKKTLPKAFLNFLQTTKELVTVTSTVAVQKTSADRSTTKLAIRLHDGQLVESVLMRYVSKDGSRASLCVSSQVGCAMGCTFCATGTMGLWGNLTTGEILEQVVHADRILADEWMSRKENSLKLDLVRNVVFMGQGEPLDNFPRVVDACRALFDRRRWNFAHGRVTVSTVGVVPMMRKLTKELPEVGLALSLHAPNQELRSQIVPTAKHFPMESLIEALDEHMMACLRIKSAPGAVFTTEERIKESTRRRAMIEYVMLTGPTSTFESAHELGRLCQGRHLVVNLIPYNATDVEDDLQCPSDEHLMEFKRIVSSYGTFCTIRRTMGADIDSACGQLITKEKAKASKAPVVRDIEDALGALPKEQETPSTSTRRSTNRDSTTHTPNKRQADVAAPLDEGYAIDKWIQPLAIATTVSATCFMISTTLFLRQRRR